MIPFKVEPHPPDIRWVSDYLCLSVVSDGGIEKIGTYLFNRRTGKDRRLTSRAADLQSRYCFARGHKVEMLTDLGSHTSISSLILANNGKFYGTTAEQVFSQSLDDSNEEPDGTSPQSKVRRNGKRSVETISASARERLKVLRKFARSSNSR